DAPAFDVARIVNLATPLFGDLTEIPHVLHLHPRSDPRVRLSRLSDVVTAVLGDLRVLLRRVRLDHDVAHGRGADMAAGRRADPTDPISARAGSFGVLVTVE